MKIRSITYFLILKLLDLAALSLRLDKPLTARLMPIPGKKAGDWVAFNFPYFANSRVLEVRAKPLSGLLTTSEIIALSACKGIK